MRLVVQNDGNAVVYLGYIDGYTGRWAEVPLWATNTNLSC